MCISQVGVCHEFQCHYVTHDDTYAFTPFVLIVKGKEGDNQESGILTSR